MFDPRALPKKGQSTDDMKRVWCAENVKIAYEAYEQGLPLVSTPFITGMPNLRRPNLLYEWSDWELKEAIKCKNDIIYFAENYVSLYRPDGSYGLVKWRDYQKRYLKLLQENRFVVFVAARQIGKTTTSAAFLLWCMLFLPNYKMCVLGDKRATSIENLTKMKDMYNLLPFFLKPGVISWNQGNVVFDNGSLCNTGPCKLSAVVGKSYRAVYFDEWAIPDDKEAREVTEFVVPTITNLLDGRVVMTSSPRGAHGPFYEIYTKATMGKGPFKPFSVHWSEVPGRDEKWKEDMVSILGERGFAQQYGNQFLNDGTEWLSAETTEYLNLLMLEADFQRAMDNTDNERALSQLAKVERVIMKSRYRTQSMIMPEQKLLSLLQFDYNYVKTLSDLRKMPIIITIDTAEGRESDHTIADFWLPEFGEEQSALVQQAYEAEQADLEQSIRHDTGDYDDEDDMLNAMVDADETDVDELTNDYLTINGVRCRQIGVLDTDKHAIPMVALFLQVFAHFFLDMDRLKIVCELDGIGSKMQALLATDIIKNSAFEPETFGSQDGKHPGIYMRGNKKKAFVYDTQQYLEDGRILVAYGASVYEVGKFQEIRPGKFAGVEAHDDHAMAIVQLGGYMSSLDFKIFVEETLLPDDYDENEEDDYS